MTCIDKNVAFDVKMAPKQSGPTFLMDVQEHAIK